MGNIKMVCLMGIAVFMFADLLLGVCLYLFKCKLRYKELWGQISLVCAIVLIVSYLLLFGGHRTEVMAREVSVTKVYDNAAAIEWTDSYDVTYVYQVATEEFGEVHSGDTLPVTVQVFKNVFGVTVIETPMDLYIYNPRECHVKKK